MKRALVVSSVVVAVLAVAVPATAQLRGIMDKASKVKSAIDDYNYTPEEERTLGEGISAKLREKYGVVQDREVHKYVTLVGRVLAQESSQPDLRWTFIVLDTDGVNAFATPGGFVHITKGALALTDNEAELASVLGHEIGHIIERHTVKAIQNAQKAGLVGEAVGSRSELLQRLINVGYDTVLESNFDRDQENASDRRAITMANKVGYAPQGLGGFLTKLSERNKGLKERSGMFATHPALQARIQEMTREISRAKLTSTAMVTARFTAAITYTPVPVDAIPQSAPPSASASSSGGSSGGGRTGLSSLNPLGRERSSSQTVSSAGARGLNPDRDARGGPNKGAVTVTVTAAEIAAFRKGIA
jgi:predicted Zn-dependent protease